MTAPRPRIRHAYIAPPVEVELLMMLAPIRQELAAEVRRLRALRDHLRALVAADAPQTRYRDANEPSTEERA